VRKASFSKKFQTLVLLKQKIQISKNSVSWTANIRVSVHGRIISGDFLEKVSNHTSLLSGSHTWHWFTQRRWHYCKLTCIKAVKKVRKVSFSKKIQTLVLLKWKDGIKDFIVLNNRCKPSKQSACVFQWLRQLLTCWCPGVSSTEGPLLNDIKLDRDCNFLGTQSDCQLDFLGFNYL
jgi:hypothetical protein